MSCEIVANGAAFVDDRMRMKDRVFAEYDPLSDNGERTYGWIVANLCGGCDISKRMNAGGGSRSLIEETERAGEIMIGIL